MRNFIEILNEGKYSGVLPDNPTDEDTHYRLAKIKIYDLEEL